MDAPPRKLLEDPLSLVLAEFRFSTVQMENYAPTFHERIRKRFPLDSMVVQQQVQIANNSFGLQSTNQWCYTSADSTRAVMIGKDRLIYMESVYDTFGEFCNQCVSILEELKEVVDPSLLMRVGFRYVNNISPDEDGTDSELSKCVESQFLPVDALTTLGDSTHHHKFELVIKTDENSTLVIRSLSGKHGLSIMPDLKDGLPVQLKSKGSFDQVALLLDIDHFWSTGKPAPVFDVDEAQKHLVSLHDTACEAFWRSTTEYAREELWKQQT